MFVFGFKSKHRIVTGVVARYPVSGLLNRRGAAMSDVIRYAFGKTSLGDVMVAASGRGVVALESRS